MGKRNISYIQEDLLGTIISVGAGASIVNDGVSPTKKLKSLVAGTDISIVSAANTLTINNTGGAGGVTLTSAGGTESLVNDGFGPSLANKGLTAGTGISLTGAATSVTIANTDLGSSVTLTSAGGTETLVNDGVGPTLANKGLTAGTGISLTGAATSVTIANTDLGSSVTLTSAGGTETLVNDGSGPTLATKGLTAGTNVTLSSTGSAVTINSSASAAEATNTTLGTVYGENSDNSIQSSAFGLNVLDLSAQAAGTAATLAGYSSGSSSSGQVQDSTGMGWASLSGLTGTCERNTAFGSSAGREMVDSTDSVMLGVDSFYGGKAVNCVAAGTSTGQNGNWAGSVLIGYNAGGAGPSLAGAAAFSNVFIGSLAASGGTKTTATVENTGVGKSSFTNLTSGLDNSAFGYDAGTSISSGGKNSCFGASANVSSATADQRIVIGYSISGGTNSGFTIPSSTITATSATAVLFSSSISTTAAAANATLTSGQLLRSTSSAKYKENIKPITFDSYQILKLDAREFDCKLEGLPNGESPAEAHKLPGSVQGCDHCTLYDHVSKGGKTDDMYSSIGLSPVLLETAYKNGAVHCPFHKGKPADHLFGYIAEEVALKFPQVVTMDDEGEPNGIQYERLVVPLIEIVKDLNNQVLDLNLKVAALMAV